MGNYTRDYDKFKLLEENRTVSKSHVNKLKIAIGDNPNIMRAQPILVNEDMEVIDGQHRLQACRELDIPVYYNIVEHLTVKEARNINVVHRTWSSMDYAESYAKAGNVYYKALVAYKNENPSISLSIVRFICQGPQSRETNLIYTFRTGDFTIGRDSEDIEWMLAKVNAIHDINDGEIPVQSAFVRAFVEACDNHEDFEPEVFMRNLKANPTMFKRVSTVRDALRMIEDIHNYGRSVNKIRLY